MRDAKNVKRNKRRAQRLSNNSEEMTAAIG